MIRDTSQRTPVKGAANPAIWNEAVPEREEVEGLARAALLYLVRASVIQCKLQPVAANSIASFQKLVSRGCGALTVQMPILAGSIGTPIDALPIAQ